MTESPSPESPKPRHPFRITRKAGTRAKEFDLNFIDNLSAELSPRDQPHVRAGRGMARIDIVSSREVAALQHSYPQVNEVRARSKLEHLKQAQVTTLDEFLTFKLGDIVLSDMGNGHRALGAEVLDEDTILARERQAAAVCLSAITEEVVTLEPVDFYLLLAVCDDLLKDPDPLLDYAADHTPEKIHTFEPKVRSSPTAANLANPW